MLLLLLLMLLLLTKLIKGEGERKRGSSGLNKPLLDEIVSPEKHKNLSD